MAAKTKLAALELFCGIGGFAAAVAGTNVRVVAALDQSPVALSVYRLNFPGHVVRQVDLARIDATELEAFGAEFWWLSPPCQPYSVRGRRLDLADPRARSLARILEVFPKIPPDRLPLGLALENVPGFARSQARQLLVRLLTERGYAVRERQLCPTELGVPSRRPRYYLVASRNTLALSPTIDRPRRQPLRDFLDPSLAGQLPGELAVPEEVVTRFGEGMRILEPLDRNAYTTCFTAGYGKSLMHAGSYLRSETGIRRFAPQELAALLHLPSHFRFPEELSLRKRWHLLGNSLSVIAVREVLRDLAGNDPSR